MMTQTSALSPIASYGTRQAAHRAKPLMPAAGSATSGAAGVSQVMLQVKRLLVIAAASAATVGSPAVPSAAARAQTVPAAPRTLAPPPVRDEDRSGGDHLTVTVRHTGTAADGTHDLYCHPGGGTHLDVTGACEAVGRNTQWGKDPFAPVPRTACAR